MSPLQRRRCSLFGLPSPESGWGLERVWSMSRWLRLRMPPSSGKWCSLFGYLSGCSSHLSSESRLLRLDLAERLPQTLFGKHLFHQAQPLLSISRSLYLPSSKTSKTCTCARMIPWYRACCIGSSSEPPHSGRRSEHAFSLGFRTRRRSAGALLAGLVSTWYDCRFSLTTGSNWR